ncbi:MAG: TrmB family transcriptional regulator [Candidatus Bathyarchaeia archaeon]|jgi:sugar-specific transcriptional regulator TrmB
MNNNPQADTKVLTQLGLTFSQAQVYLTLTKLGTGKAKTVATINSLDRANVYRVLSDLQKLNLIEKMLTNPINFKALPIKEGIQMLLENRQKEQQEIESRTKELIEKYKKTNFEKPAEDCQFSLIPENKAILRKIREMNESCQECYDLIFNGRSFFEIIDDMKICFKSLFKKGVTMRFIVYLNEGEKLFKELSSLPRNRHLTIRFTSQQPTTLLLLCDKKDALINTTSSMHIKETSLWSNNPVMVSILQEHFNQSWKEAKQIFPNEKLSQQKVYS